MQLHVWAAETFIKKIVEAQTPRPPIDVHRARVEDAAMKKLEAHFKALGYSVKYCDADNLGWDFEAKKAATTLHLEVKGLSGDNAVVELTPNEYKAMQERPSSYQVCIVTNALEDEKRRLRVFACENDRWVSKQGELLNIQPKTAARISVSQHRR
jgi:Domain of unknown function (DUF3883)